MNHQVLYIYMFLQNVHNTTVDLNSELVVFSAGNDGSFNVYLGSFDRVTRIAQLDYSMGKGYEFLASLLPEVTGGKFSGTGWRLLDSIRSSFNDVVVSKTQELLEDFCSLDFFFFFEGWCMKIDIDLWFIWNTIFTFNNVILGKVKSWILVAKWGLWPHIATYETDQTIILCLKQITNMCVSIHSGTLTAGIFKSPI